MTLKTILGEIDKAGTILAIKDYIDKTVYIEKDFNKDFNSLTI